MVIKASSDQGTSNGTSHFVARYAEVTGATGDEIVLNFTHKSGAGSSCWVYQYVIDGQALVDGTGGGPDTVLDTPMKNYAVLDTVALATLFLLRNSQGTSINLTCTWKNFYFDNNSTSIKWYYQSWRDKCFPVT